MRFLRFYLIGINLFLAFCAYSQTLTLGSTPIGGGNFNIQSSFTGNASCTYTVTLTCPTCTPTSAVCAGVKNGTDCTVTLALANGSNNITATAVRTAGSGQQCPANLEASLSVLPIEMKSFDLVNDKNQTKLIWSTASETNNDYFNIERSADGRSFDVIGEIKGAGNSNTTLSYEFVDEKPFAGINYYRIKQTDFDGKFSYSDIKSVRHTSAGNLSITPRTTEGRLQVTTEIEDYSIDVYNVTGQQVKSFKSLSFDQFISIDDLTAGLYYVKVNFGGQVETTKIVKI